MAMENKNEYVFEKSGETLKKYAILQVSAVTLILLILFVIRMVSGTSFSQFCETYKYYFTDETEVETEEKANTDATDRPVPVSLTYNRTEIGSINALCVPVKGTLTSGFGKRPDPFTNAESNHCGIDIAAPYGTEIACCSAGTVEKTGYESGYGNFVIVKHSESFKSLYGHCSKITVSVGDEVTAGQTVALVGSTGRSTGNHVHFEIRINGNKVDPLWYLSLEGEK